jgi:hypothetical protein
MLRALDTAVAVVGVLSFLSLIGYLLALHDIWRDYASPGVWAYAGQPLPDWYAPWNRTPGEWRIVQVGFLIFVVFHGLLFARYLVRFRTRGTGASPGLTRGD